MSDYIEVDFYVMGVYQGKRKISKHGLAGQLLSGDYGGAANAAKAMQDEINEIAPGTCKVSIEPQAPPAEE